MLKNNKKIIVVRILLAITILLELTVVISSAVSEVSYESNWAPFFDNISYVTVCIVLMIKTEEICFFKCQRILAFPVMYLVWNQIYFLYYFVRNMQLTISYQFLPFSEKISMLFWNCLPKVLIFLLLIIIVYLLFFKLKKYQLSFALTIISLIIQIFDKIPPVIRQIPILINSSISDSYHIISVIANNIANIGMYCILAIFLYILYRTDEQTDNSV